MTEKEFLFTYLNNASPVGFESSGQKIWLDYIKPFVDEYMVDTYGTVVGVVNPTAEYKVVIEAHADEISWYVNHITDDGYIYVIRNGGSDPIIAPSMRVNIHTKQGIVKGVFGWPAIHVRFDEKDNPKPDMKNIFIDVGCENKEEVEKLGIHVGSVATFVDELMEMNDKFYVGRALDNRMGGYMIAQVARLLKENNQSLDFGLYIVNAVQEEVGLRGAEMITNRIKPHVAICTDVCHDSFSPLVYDKKKDGAIKCGKGAVLSYAPAVHNILRDLIIDVATEKNIPFQRLASSRWTGTDTDAFAYSNGGVASALISLPLKYMHTTVETVMKEDVDSVIRLMYEVLLTLKAGQDFRYFI
jgi:tetrahedral aminopeptidase